MNKKSDKITIEGIEGESAEVGCKGASCIMKGVSCIIKGISGSGKTRLLLERYKYMTNVLGISDDSILVLLSGRQQLQSWKYEADDGFTAGARCFTFGGFIQEELVAYYPLVTISDKEIGQKDIMPLFLGYDASNFLVSRSIQLRRERERAFQGLVSTNEKAAAQLLKSLSAAVSNDIPANEAAIRLAEALERKSAAKTGILSEAYSIMKAYRNKCLELGVFDTELCISLYAEYLLGNPFYCNNLKKKIRYVLVDDLQSCTPVQIKLLEVLAGSCGSYAFTLNSGIKAGEYNLHIFNFITKLENKGCLSIDLNKSYTCSEEMFYFSELFTDSAVYTGEFLSADYASTLDKALIPGVSPLRTDFVERHPPTELRSEMLQQLGERICSLIEIDGCKPDDIVILSTHADIVTELAISEVLATKGIKLCNISRNEKVHENRLCRAILTFMQLCHPDCKSYPTRDDLRIMLCKLLKLDNVRSSVLAGWISSAAQFPAFPEENRDGLADLLGEDTLDQYIYIKHWADEYMEAAMNKTPRLSAGEFIMKALVEIFLDEAVEREELLKVRKMADAAARYEEAGSRFGRNIIRDFADISRKLSFINEDTIKGEGTGNVTDNISADISEGSKSKENQSVILTTPSAFLAEGICCKTAVICSLSSRNWLQGGAGELYNPYVLNESWNRENSYTAEMDRLNQWRQMTQTLGMVLKRCGNKIITFESKLSENGFENDGPLPELLSTFLNENS